MPGTVQARGEQCCVEGAHGVLWQETGALFPSGQLKLLLQDAILAPEALPGGHTHLSTCHPTMTLSWSPRLIMRQPTPRTGLCFIHFCTSNI